MGSRLLSNSRLKVARSCQREHFNKYVLGFRPLDEGEALRFGTLIHLGLEAWWKASGDRLQAALDAISAVEDLDPFDRVKAEVMLHGYHFRWCDEPYEVLAVEAHFECELVNPTTGRPSQTWRLGGKLDVIVRCLRTGHVLIIEHKTSSEDITPGSPYWRRLRMDSQVSTYYEGAQALGYDVRGCLYDVLGKPGLRPLKATPVETRKYTKKGELYANQRAEDETPEEYRERLILDMTADPAGYFQRGDVVRLETEMAEALYDIWQTAQQIRESELAKRHPRNPDACQRYGRLCPYFEVCTGAASLEDPLLFTKSDDVHPELAGDTAVQPKEEAAHV